MVQKVGNVFDNMRKIGNINQQDVIDLGDTNTTPQLQQQFNNLRKVGNFNTGIGNIFEDTAKYVTPRSFISEIPGATKKVFSSIKDFLLPSRGFTEEDIKNTNPSFKESATGGLRLGSEILGGLGRIGMIIGDKITSPSKEDRDAAERIVSWLEEKGKPKTAGEAKSMRLGDVMTAIPASWFQVGKAGILSKLAKTKELDEVLNVTKNLGLTIDKEGAREIANTDNTRLIDSILEYYKSGTEKPKQLLKDDSKKLLNGKFEELKDLRIQGKVGPFYRANTIDYGTAKALHGKIFADSAESDGIVTVYRAGKPEEKLTDGTFLTADKEMAKSYKNPNVKGNFGGSEIYTYKIPSKDLVSVDNMDFSELIYKPNNKESVLDKSVNNYFEAPKNAKEKETIYYVKNNLSKAKLDYVKKIKDDYKGLDNVVSADSAKYVIPGYQGSEAADYHEAASGLAKIMYDDMLVAKKGEGNNTVMFMAGGTGSGKTSAIRRIMGDTLKEYPIIYDTNTAVYKSSASKIQRALDNGYKVEITFVQRDPVAAFREGVIPRVKKENRVVSIDTHIKMHQDALPTIEKLEQRFGDKISVRLIDNTGAREDVKLANMDKLPKYSYNNNELREKLYEETKNAYREGKITKEEASNIFRSKERQGGAGNGGKYKEEQVTGKYISEKAPSISPSKRSDLEYRRSLENLNRAKTEEEITNAILEKRYKDLSFVDSEQESGYKNFKELIKNRKWILDPDVDDMALKRRLKGYNVDGNLFEGAKDISNDDLLDKFKGRYFSELDLKEALKEKTPDELRAIAKREAEKIVKRNTVKGEASPKNKFVKKSEKTLLKERLKQQAKGARIGKQAGKREVLAKQAKEKYIKTLKKEIEEAISNAVEKPRRELRQKIGFQIHTKEPAPSTMTVLKDKHGIKSFKKASEEQLKGFYKDILNLKKGEVLPPGRGGVKLPEFDFKSWVDKGALKMSRETMERNLEMVAGKESEKAKDFLVRPTRDNEVSRIEFLNNERKEIRDKMKSLGIKAGSKEDKAIQLLGEKEISDLTVKHEFPKKYDQIKEAVQFFRNKYDDYISKLNEIRESFGYKPIPKRKDYFRHFQELNDMTNFFGLTGKEHEIPTEIAGLTYSFKPGKPFSTVELSRMGEKTDVSAIRGIDNYLNAMSLQMFHTDSVQRGRLLEKYIRESAKGLQQVGDKLTLSNFIANLTEYTNLVSGKKATIDRAGESLLGRRIYSIVDTFRKRTGANMIIGNISSAMTNFIPITQFAATTKKVDVISGAYNAMFSPFSKSYYEISGVKSGFLIRRFPKLESIQPSKIEKAKNIAGKLFKTVDQFTSRMIVSGKFYENLGKGLLPAEAMKQADEYATKVLANRSVGDLPNIMNTKTLAPLTQFQVEVNNVYSFLRRDIPKMNEEKRFATLRTASMLAQFTIYSYLFNNIYEKNTGRRPTLDPLQAFLVISGLKEKDKPFASRTFEQINELAGNLPFIGGLTSGRYPVSSGLPDLMSVLDGKTSIGKEIAKPLFFYLPPFGGLQAKKTIEGLATYAEGGRKADSGKTLYNVEKTPENLIKSVMFGRWATPEAREYLNNFGSSQSKTLYNELKNMKPAEANSYLKKLSNSKSKTDKQKAATIKRYILEDKLGLSEKEKGFRNLGVDNGDRAVAVYKHIMESKNKNDTYKKLRKSKIITDDVAKQIKQLIKNR